MHQFLKINAGNSLSIDEWVSRTGGKGVAQKDATTMQLQVAW